MKHQSNNQSVNQWIDRSVDQL